MSFHVASICTNHKFGSATRKQVITFLADKASDDGSGIWCSKGTVARCTELSKSTVKRVFLQFLNEGILVETGKRVNSHGFTTAYCINLDKITELPLTKEEPVPAGSTVNPVPDEPPRGATVHPQGGSPRTPNHPLTIHKPPTRGRAKAADVNDLVFEKIWNAYPEDRRRNRKTCEEEYMQAVSNGTEPNDILSAVLGYSATTAGYTRSKVKFSDNWFRSANWESHIQQQNEQRKTDAMALASTLKRCEGWITTRNPMCKHITKPQVNALLENGTVTPKALALAGVAT